MSDEQSRDESGLESPAEEAAVNEAGPAAREVPAATWAAASPPPTLSPAVEELDRLLNLMQHHCLLGRAHYRMWVRLHASFGSRPRVRELAPIFFGMSAEAHLNSAFLILNRLIDRQRHTLSIEWFLDRAETSPKAFKHITPVLLREAVAEDRQRLAKLEDSLEKMRTHRNEQFVHLSKALWRLRGLLDIVAGGPGMRRGRRDPESVMPGETLDFWRVEAVEPGRLLRLAAEMRIPGRAWLQFEVTPADGGSLIRQTALFDPVGVGGLFYWYGLWGMHQMVFAGMLRNIARAATTSGVMAPCERTR
jgi:Protein of unknown function (DUF2867)/AbiU2